MIRGVVQGKIEQGVNFCTVLQCRILNCLHLYALSASIGNIKGFPPCSFWV